LIVWPDSIGYLGPAIDAIERGQFTHWYGRGFLYPFWLWMWLRISPEPTTIVLAQRPLVLVGYGCLAVAVFLLGRHVRRVHSTVRGLIPLLAAYWLLVYGLYRPVVGLAHVVMPEVLFAALLAVALLGLVTVGTSAVSPVSSVAAGVTSVTSVALVMVRPHWFLGSLMLPLALPWLAPRGQRRAVAIATVGGLAVAAVTLVWPEYRLQQRYDAYTSRVFGARSLFCNSADLIRRHLTVHATDEFGTQVRAALDRMLDEGPAHARGWELLGFNGDDCMYGETGRIVGAHFGGQADAEAFYYAATYWHALLDEPAYLPVRLVRHLRALAIKPFDSTIGDYFLYADGRSLAANREVGRMVARWHDEHADFFTGVIELPLRVRGWLLGLRLFFAGTGALLTALTLVAVVSVAPFWRRPVDRVFSRTLLVLVAAVLALNGLIATVHTFADPRYLAMQVPLFALLGFAATLTVVDRRLRSRSGFHR
jgi:hypothetical protein